MMKSVLVFGEVLFDHFPSGENVLGGAPFNVAWHLTALNCQTQLLTAIGDDSLGTEIKKQMNAWGMVQTGLSYSQHATGCVNISINQGEPNYDIAMPAAWDTITTTNEFTDGLLYHGTLALRSKHNRKEIQKLINSGNYERFVDTNLRSPWWEKDAVLQLITGANYVKMNVDEFYQLGLMQDDLLMSIRHAKQQYSIQQLLLTQGSSGAILVDDSDAVFAVKPEADIQIVDTVGAGDAFSAMFIYGTLCGWPCKVTMEYAQGLASLVLRNRGAILQNKDHYQAFTRHLTA